MGSDPGHDPGLSSSPWVAVELSAGAVTVDGAPVQGDGTAEGRYLAALQQVADEVATPLGRRVGVTVSGAAGVVGHLAVHPDGTVDSIEELVQAAHAPAARVVPVARDESAVPAAPPPPARTAATPAGAAPARGGRRTLVVASAVLLAAAAVVAAPLVNGRDGELASSSGGDAAAAIGEADTGAGDGVVEASAGGPTAETPPAAVAQEVLAASVLRLRVLLVADVTSTAPGEVTLRLPATPRVVRAEVRLRAADGRVVVRRLRLGPGRSGEVVVTDLAPGAARWTVRAPGAVASAGPVVVMAPPPEPPAPAAAPAPAAPAPSGSAGGGAPSAGGGNAGNGGGSSGSQPDPTVPIDPDDL